MFRFTLRDVHDLGQVDEGEFLRFMISTATRTKSLLNLAEIARDVRISQPSAKHWLSMLAASNIVYLLQSYFSNVIKQLLKRQNIFLIMGLRRILHTEYSRSHAVRRNVMSIF